MLSPVSIVLQIQISNIYPLHMVDGTIWIVLNALDTESLGKIIAVLLIYHAILK